MILDRIVRSAQDGQFEEAQEMIRRAEEILISVERVAGSQDRIDPERTEDKKKGRRPF